MSKDAELTERQIRGKNRKMIGIVAFLLYLAGQSFYITNGCIDVGSWLAFGFWIAAAIIVFGAGQKELGYVEGLRAGEKKSRQS